MKILIFCPAISVTSGSGIRARLIVDGLQREGLEVAVVTTRLPNDLDPESRPEFFPLNDATEWKDCLSTAVAAFGPDVVFGITEAYADMVTAVARSSKVPVAFDLHGLGFVEVLELGRGFGGRFQRVKNSLRWLSKVRSAAAVTVANPTLYPIVRRFARNAVPLFGMTNVEHFTMDGESITPGRDAGKLQVLYAGNYYKWQGVELLLKAIRHLAEDAQQFEFTLLGDVGQDAKRLEEWCVGLPPGVLNIRGAIDYRDVAAYYRGADVLVMPRPFMLSTYLAFPQKLADYLASGRVVVATDLAPHRWALERNGAGVLCPATPEGLAGALRKTLDQELRTTVAMRAREVAEDLFDHRRQCRKLIDCFEQISGSQAG